MKQQTPVSKPNDISASLLAAADALVDALRQAAAAVAQSAQAGAQKNEATSLQAGYEEQERQRILDALESTHWNKSRAAEALKMPRRTFYRRLDKYDIG